MTENILYIGDDFALMMSAFSDDGETPEDISDFDATIQFCTNVTGRKIISSTIESSELKIERRDPSTLILNVGSKFTVKLSEGVITLTVVLVHKTTGVRMTAESQTKIVKRSKLSSL